MQKPIYSPEDETLLMTKLWSPTIKDDPEAFVLFAFPWGQPNTPLANFKGPRMWQRLVLRDNRVIGSVLYARIGRQLRVAAMVDLVGENERLEAGRLASLHRTVRDAFPQAAANSSGAYTNPDGMRYGACQYCGFCQRFGCEANAKASPNVCILPNVMAPVIVLFTTRVGAVILAESGLAFLGLGVPPPAPTWGGMLSGSGRSFMYLAPWLALAPGLCWVAFDCAHNVCPDARYVRVAVGFDSQSAAPMRTSHSGAGGETVSTALQIQAA